MRGIGPGALALAFVLAAGGGGAPVRHAQVDLFLAAPVDAAALDRLAARTVPAAVHEAVAALGPDRARALVGGSGGAEADDGAERRVLRAVDVTSVAPDRVRVRVAATQDMLAGHSVADTVVRTMTGAGLQERIRLASETRGGGMSWVAWGVLLFSLLILLVKGVGWGIDRRNDGIARRAG